jgi:hypothetical protein
MAVAALLPLSLTTSSRAGGDDLWRFTIAPYLWLPSVSSTVSVDDVPLDFDADTNTSDLFVKLDFALLVAGEVRKGEFGLFYDVQALKLSDDGATSGPAGRDYDADISFGDTTLALEFRVIEEPTSALDLFAGARMYYADVDVDVGPGAVLPGFSAGQDETWVDPVIGIKTRYRFNRHWGLFGYGDIGGFGVSSKLTYPLMGTLVYEFNEHIALHAGYRVFAVDFENGGFQFDATMYGPLIGLAFSF